MGQKVHPNVIRLGIIKNWNNNWFSEKKDFCENILLNVKIKNFLLNHFNKIFISKIEIERQSEILKVNIFTSKPGIIIGKNGIEIENIKKKIFSIFKIYINISVIETFNSNYNAQLISNNIAMQLEKRILFKQIIKRYLFIVDKININGIKIRLKGRINGAEIARSEWLRIGQIPLHTFNANIDYGFSQALTKYGIIGIKVWIYHK